MDASLPVEQSEEEVILTMDSNFYGDDMNDEVENHEDAIETFEGLERLEALVEDADGPCEAVRAGEDPFAPVLTMPVEMFTPGFLGTYEDHVDTASSSQFMETSHGHDTIVAEANTFPASEGESVVFQSRTSVFKTAEESKLFREDMAAIAATLKGDVQDLITEESSTSDSVHENDLANNDATDETVGTGRSTPAPGKVTRKRSLKTRNALQQTAEESSCSHSESGGSNPHETSEERKKRMAAACRRFRAKRKMQIASLEERNKELELARKEYRHRIADLQLEAQMLRGEGEVHLRKENELLRVEIQRYKRFIQTIVDTASSAAKVQPEESYRLLCDGIDSAAGQVMGLLYTSARDLTSWKQADTVMLDEIAITVKIQYLPHGSTSKTSTRTNIRVDLLTKIPPETAYTAIWESWLSFSTVQELVNKHMPGIDVIQRELKPDFGEGNWDNENIKIVQFAERVNGEIASDSIHAFTRRYDQVVFPAGFYEPADESTFAYSPVPSEPEKAWMVMQSSGDSISRQALDIVPPAEGVDRRQLGMVEAYVIRAAPQGGSFWTGIMSFPNISCTPGDSQESYPFATDDGTISSHGLAYFGIQRDIIRSHPSLHSHDEQGCALQ